MLFETKTTNNELASFDRLYILQIFKADKIYNKALNMYCVPFFTMGDIDAIILLYRILYHFKKCGARVVISTYGITQKFVNQIAMFKRAGLIEHVTLIVSNNLKTTQPNLVGHINQVFDEVKLCEVHAKIMTITDGHQNFTVISSMNLTRNNKAESGFVSTLPQHFIEAESFYNSL